MKTPPSRPTSERYQCGEQIQTTPGYVRFRAADRQTGQSCNLLALRRELYEKRDAHKKLKRLAKSLLHVRHDHVVAVHHIETNTALPYVVTEALPEHCIASLADANEADTISQFKLIYRAVGEALAAAHAGRLVHGWMTPHHVLRDGPIVKVCGVGLHSACNASEVAPWWAGYEHYVAPEVLEGASPTPVSDVYSTAVVLSELLAEPDEDDVRTAVRETFPDLAIQFERATHPHPGARPQTMRALLGLIEQATTERSQVRRRVKARRSTDDSHVVGADRPQVVDINRTQRDEQPPAYDAEAAARAQLADVGPRDAELARALEQTKRGHRLTRPADRGDDGGEDTEPVTHQPMFLEQEGDVATGMPSVSGSDEHIEQPIRFVSMKPDPAVTVPRSPIVAAIDRPELQPRLRPIPRESHVAGELGHYAPPRRRALGISGSVWRPIGIALVAAGAGAAAVWWVVRAKPGAPTPTGAPAAEHADAKVDREPAVAPAIDASKREAPKRCPSGMVYVRRMEVCIDAFEYPGKDRIPSSGVRFAEARSSCALRDTRLCTSREWLAGCRGPGDAKYPYGPRFRRGPCNSGGDRSEIASTGSFRGCRSAVGAYDMVGNVAEWVRGGAIKGGSVTESGRLGCVTRDRRNSTRSYADVGFRCCTDAASDAQP